jgi:hypothetical protein
MSKPKSYLAKKLPKAFKKKWVNALRSGNFQQGAGNLYDSDDNTYCCLGVAGAICGIPKAKLNGVGFLDTVSTVKKLAEKNKIPTILINSEDDALPTHLAEMNDGLNSFKKIAAYIERYL